MIKRIVLSISVFMFLGIAFTVYVNVRVEKVTQHRHILMSV